MKAPAPEAVRAPRDLAPFIDHAVLHPTATLDDVKKACEDAARLRLAGVCVRGEWVAEAARFLAGSGVMPVAVVDFPAGTGTTASRVVEARGSIACGAAEIDVVIACAQFKARDYRYVLEDLAEIVGRAHVPVKVILETARLTHDEKVVACALAKAAGADFVKTSTGFAEGGATVEDVALLRSVVGPEVGVKASGGVRTAAEALRMLKAGANRIGTSQSVAIVTATGF
jgi:deoxyribose-phosphate aldolase